MTTAGANMMTNEQTSIAVLIFYDGKMFIATVNINGNLFRYRFLESLNRLVRNVKLNVIEYQIIRQDMLIMNVLRFLMFDIIPRLYKI